MDPERWRRIRELYLDARGHAAREAFLREKCAGDEALRREVQDLLDQPRSTNDLVKLLGGPELALVTAAGDPPDRVSLTGRQIGTYRVGTMLGAGAMGEVYRARDTKLDRDVALKVLRGALVADGDRLKRFEHEARVLASLNHPNIAAIYGLEDSHAPALVLELVEGETLRERLAKGPMPAATALSAARQIVNALDAAHARGIIHRDLKPANIKITPENVVKVLDFGIAKVLTDDGPTHGAVPPWPSTSSATQTGFIMGTAAYMSPEQARGEPVDKRADIWAFGCVLYEMLSGRAVFALDTVAETLTAIATLEPDWTALPAKLPSAVRRLLRSCLEKDASRRLRDIADARAALEGPSRTLTRATAALAAVVSIVAGGGTLFYATRPAPPPSPAEYTQITNFTDSAVSPSLSHDGRMVTFIRGGDAFLSRGQIWLKVLPDGEPVQLTSDASVKYGPVFTPDGSRVTYTRISSSGGVNAWDAWAVPTSGGEPVPFLSNAAGLTWLTDRRMLFAAIKTGIHMA
jgi:serine/threonine protein kinase